MIYEYECGECGVIEVSRPMTESANPVMCSCGRVARRIFTPVSIRVIKKERLQYGYGSPGRILTRKETGGLDVFIPSMGAMEQDEVDYIAEGAIEKERERVKKVKKFGARSENQARLQEYMNLALKTPRGKRAKVLSEAAKDTGDTIRGNKGQVI